MKTTQLMVESQKGCGYTADNQKGAKVCGVCALLVFNKYGVNPFWLSTNDCISLDESQKGAFNIQRCFIEKQKGPIVVQIFWQ